MKTSVIKYKNILFSAVLILLLSACGEMLDNPLQDKETGEKINLLIVDFNFFTTRMTYKLVDVADETEVQQEARIWFTGTNAGDIVTFSGEKETEHITSQGQLELTVDPNIEFSAESPLDYTVHVAVDGYEEFAQPILVNSEGKKTFELYLSPLSGGDEEIITGGEDPNNDDSFIFMIFGNKSASVLDKPYVVNYSIKKNDVLAFTDYYGQPLFQSLDEMMAAYQSDPANFLKLTMDIKTGFPAVSGKIWVNDLRKNALIQKLETGNLISLVIGGKRVYNLNSGAITQTCAYTENPEPDQFGFSEIVNEAWLISSEPKVYTSLEIAYTVAAATIEQICTSGVTINFTSSSKTSFSIYADVYNTADQRIMTTNFKGTFPESFVLENVPDVAAKIVFRNNNPGFKQIAPLEVSSLCSGNFEVDVQAAAGYVEYLVVLKAHCSDNPEIALAPTYSGEMRIKNSNDSWQGVDMVGGVTDILTMEHQDYEIRFLWEGDWETSSFSTEFDSNGNYLGKSESKVTSERMEDGRIKIMIDHTFEQDVCDSLNW